ncbi:alkaline phosphatase family protein [Naasia sp. SYSU D00057]|uniref:alkaline phosphatase family protein n=1 Tax=Naasia sp. SYSU D00057 TaxID=2817380 RepID=UPI001B310669|nr:alkaline phosphatase family protein [Naasia sp. SYSU D00057]
MVPTTSGAGPHLGAVLPGCVAALLGRKNPLGLPAARSVIVVVVDGLGASALKSRRGHARTLAGALTSSSVITTGVPTTTAAALTTLMTGEDPGQHGVVGYAVLDEAGDRVVNQLNGWGGSVDPLVWQRRPTIFESGTVRGVAVGAKKYRSSGFTAATLRGGDYRPADEIGERFDVALEAAREAPGTLVYLYIPEADQAAHAEGWQSDRWTAALEEIDGALTAALPRLGKGNALLVTADHGIVDVPGSRHVLIDERRELVDGVRHVGGEPRMLHLYFEPDLPDVERAALLDRWRAAEGERAWVRGRDEAIAEGWFGAAVDAEVAPRIGDILVAARGSVAYYDSRTATVGARAMIGQHGSWTPEETRVPLLRFPA